MAETERLHRQRLSGPQIAHVLGMAVSTMGVVRRRLAYTETLPSERKEDTTAFLERAVAIGPWTHSYNVAKPHAGLKGRTPLQSVNNLRGNNDEDDRLVRSRGGKRKGPGIAPSPRSSGCAGRLQRRRAVSATPMTRGSFTNAVLLLKSMPPLMFASSVMFRPNSATSQEPSSRA